MANNTSNSKNRTIFKVIFVAFLAIVLYFLYDLSRQTTAPWNKKKQLERAL
jgi:hypothetical protein